MTISEIKEGDLLVARQGAGYFRVLKVNRTTVSVLTDQGRVIKAYPQMFDRNVSKGD